MNFSVYYQVYKNLEQTNFVLSKFREHNKDEFIYLISDGGDDFSELAKKYNCYYVHDEKNLGYYDHFHPLVLEHRKNNLSGGHPYGWDKNESDHYLKRFLDCSNKSNSDYILLLEDDVIVNHKLSDINLLCDITVANTNNKFSQTLVKYLQNNNISCNIFGWGMCGGNFIKRKTFIEGYNKSWDKFYKIYDEFYKNIFQSVGWCDVLFSLVISELNPTVSENIFYSENNPTSPIFHNRSHRN